VRQVLPELQTRFGIRRARMRLKLQVPAASELDLEKALQQEDALVEMQDISPSQVLAAWPPGQATRRASPGMRTLCMAAK
jgi:hypothetical protein